MSTLGPAAARLATLHKRARIVQAIRAFFIDRGYLEVETLHRIPGNAPETHIDPVPSGDWQLHTSPELAMKRLLAAGSGPIFQLCRCWREEERGSRHLPEFMLLEWYRPGVDYRYLMDECEALLRHLTPGGRLHWQGYQIDLTGPAERLTVAEAFARHTSTTLEDSLAQGTYDEIMAFEIEPRLGLERPCFLLDYPAELAALARKKAGAPEVAERFELYVAGLELANAFSELTDPVEQGARFKQDNADRLRLGKKALPLPEPFLKDMAALPEAAGIALGVDRLVMLLTDANTIDEVVAFTPEEL